MPTEHQPIAYTVIATLPDDRTAQEFIGWLRSGHVAAVIAGGAQSAAVVLLDPEPGQASRQVEVRYRFASPASYEAYVATAAPGLRAEGLARFGPTRGVTFARRLGQIAFQKP